MVRYHSFQIPTCHLAIGVYMEGRESLQTMLLTAPHHSHFFAINLITQITPAEK